VVTVGTGGMYPIVGGDIGATLNSVFAAEVTGGTAPLVQILPGTYNAATTVLLPNQNSFRLIGAGATATTINWSGAGTLFRNSTTTSGQVRNDWRIGGFQITGTGANQTGLTLYQVKLGQFFDITFGGTLEYGYKLLGACYYNTLTKMNVSSADIGLLLDENAGDGLFPNENIWLGGRYTSTTTSVKIVDGNGNHFYSQSYEGFGVSGDSSQAAVVCGGDTNQWIACRLESNVAGSVTAFRFWATSNSNAVTDCRIDGTATSDFATSIHDTGTDNQFNGISRVGLSMAAPVYEQPRAKAHRSANFTTDAGGAWEVVGFDSETFDTGAFHSNSTNNSRFTIPEDGQYRVTVNAVWAANPTGSRRIAVEKNAAGVKGDGVEVLPPFAAAGCDYTYQGQSVSFSTGLVAGDYLELFVSQNAGTGLSLIGTATRYTSFLIERIGD
jgi:hypothetical protein